MQREGLLIVGGDNNDRANRSKNDFYETPQIAIDCLMQKETFKSVILEPCAGKGAISEVLANRYNKTVISNDIPYHIYYYRVKHGYSLYYALSMPVSRKGADDDRAL